jgi:tRNA (guanine37-N1)-methyltransferase
VRIDVITLFPEMFAALDASIPGRARKAGALDLRCHALRDFAINRYGQVDDVPFGGEPGMVLRPEPLKAALDKVRGETGGAGRVIHLSAQGRPFQHAKAVELAGVGNFILICGHYKGIDQRFIDTYVDEELSLGDFVLSGGEIAGLAVIDAVARLLPGVLGDPGSAETDSFHADHRLGWPVYTRPQNFEGRAVPEVLLSGHHENIRKWRIKAGLEATRKFRPDLFARLQLTDEEKKLLGT